MFSLNVKINRPRPTLTNILLYAFDKIQRYYLIIIIIINYKVGKITRYDTGAKNSLIKMQISELKQTFN